jgi:hypothetical protein
MKKNFKFFIKKRTNVHVREIRIIPSHEIHKTLAL